MKSLRMAVAMVALVALALPATAAEEIDKSDNVKHVFNGKYDGGTELAAMGKYVYSAELNGGPEFPTRGTKPDEGGLHIYHVSGKKPKEVGFLHCPGADNDVEVVKPGLVVMGFSNNKCAPAAGTGLMTIDVKNPKKPRVVGMVNTGKAHTLKPIPGTKYIYMAGGSVTGGPAAGPAIVDVGNPAKPKVVGGANTYTMDCHDISFWATKDNETRLAFCAGAVGTGEVQIFDASDPLEPTLISKIVNPAIQYSHYAVASTDGQYLAIDDEAFALHECVTGQTPTGRVWIYDISNPAVPIPHGSFAAPRGGGDVPIGTYVGWVPSWCLSHGLDWQPGTHNLGVTWFTGGWSVINVDDPVVPTEVAYGQFEESYTYSVLWHRGLFFTNDTGRGLDAFKIKGLK
jgi:hypothetical protein